MNTNHVKIKTPDNFLLDAVFNQIEGSKKAIILAHGMTVDKDEETLFASSESKLNNLGFSTLRFDFRAHGRSQGNSVIDFTISGELEDLKTIFNFVENKNIPWIGLAGASFGGSIASIFAGYYPDKINALLLANPVLDYNCFLNPKTSWAKKYFTNLFDNLNKNSFIEVGSHKFKIGKKLFDEMMQYQPFQFLEKYQGQVIIIHGDHDTKVACQDSIDFYNQLSNRNKKLEILKGADHGFHNEPYTTQAVNIIADFFSSLA